MATKTVKGEPRFKEKDTVSVRQTSPFHGQPENAGCINRGSVIRIEQSPTGNFYLVAFEPKGAASKRELFANTYAEDDLEKAGIEMAERSVERKAEPDKKKRINIEISRKEGRTKFTFSVDANITRMYEAQSKETRESSAWPGLSFYLIPSLTKDDYYKQKCQSYGLFDDYGSALYRDGKLNIAWLRTVGGRGEITVEDSIPYAEINVLVKNVVGFIKEYFTEYYKEYVIRGFVNIEV